MEGTQSSEADDAVTGAVADVVADAGGGPDHPGDASSASDGKAASSASGGTAKSGYAPVPFPADEIGKPKGPSVKAAADGAPASVGASETGGDGRADSQSTGNGMLDTGRQAVRQAMAATNSWFARSGKSDAAARPGDGAGGAAGAASAGAARSSHSAAPAAPAAPAGSAGSPGDRRPSFTPSAPAQPPAAATSHAFPGPSAQPAAPSYYQTPSAFSGSPTPSGPHYPAPGARPSDAGAGISPGATGVSPGKAPTVGGAAAGLAGYASSVTNAWQKRGTDDKRKRGVPRRKTRRQAQLTLARVEPWSVMKFSFIVSVVAFIILLVAVAVLYSVLSSLGVFTSVQHTVTTITSGQGSKGGTNISGWFSASRILGYTAMFGALNIVLITAMSTIGAVVYNLIARTVGGIEITLRETE